jgi:hypothetical protein
LIVAKTINATKVASLLEPGDIVVEISCKHRPH